MSGIEKHLRAGVVVTIALCGTLAGAVAALGGHGSAPPSFTGCLNTSSGTIVNVAEGTEPLAACKEKEPLVHFSGGDVTAVTAGEGLSGGGAGGALELSVGSAAVVTGVLAGFGLSGGAGGGDVTLAVDPTVIQRRVVTDCGPGAIAKINQDSSAVCSSSSQLGLVATLDAGFASASGSSNTDLCDEGHNEGGMAGPFTSTAGPVELSEGFYMVVPRSFRWELSKTVEWGDEEVFYAGDVAATLGGTSFIREFNSRGLIVEPNRNWGGFAVGSGGMSATLEITAEAWACSHAEVGGSVAIVRIG